ncbi:MAG: PAS domain-containing protein [Myxococcales bacterium]|nr:PAS domain-containing protein [Myxococcales bacterium]
MTASSLSFLMDHSPVALSLHWANGQFVMASAACGTLLGVAASALCGQLLFDWVNPFDVAALRSAWDLVCATQNPTTIRFRLHPSLAPQGVRWLEANIGAPALPSSVASGASESQASQACTDRHQLVICLREVTQQVAADAQRTERLLQAELAERHRDHLAQMLPGLMWFGPVSPDLSSYRVVYINEYLFRVTGYTSSQWLETPGFWRSILHPEDRDWVLREVAAAGLEERSLGPYRVICSDGSVRWLQSSMRIERNDLGVPVRMYGLTLDMTRLKQQEAERIAALMRVEVLKQRMDALVDTLPGVVWESWLSETQHSQNYCSDFVSVLTGHSKEQWLGHDQLGWLAWVPAPERATVAQEVERVQQVGEGSLQHRLMTRDGRELWVEHHMVALRDAQGRALCLRGIALDITNSKKAEEERLQLERAITQQTQRLLELSTPLIPVSDEVLVMPLIGALDAARTDYAQHTLLSGVHELGARFVLLDLTGVGQVDDVAAVALVQLVKAVRMLGAQVLLTGMRAEIARSLGRSGVDLSGILTKASLRDAIREYVLRRPVTGSKSGSKPSH